MYCNFCGAEINGRSKFCTSCGKPLNPSAKAATGIWTTIFCCLIGTLFIAAGILPYLLQGDMMEYRYYISSLYEKYSSLEMISAISCFTQFSSLLSPLFYFSSSFISIYVGLMILKKGASNASVILCAAVNLVSVIYSGILYLLIHYSPRLIISLYTNHEAIMEAGEDIIRSKPHMLYFYRDDAVNRSIISLAIIVLAVLFFIINKTYKVTAKKPAAGGIAMIFSVSVISTVSNVISPALAAPYGSYATSANTIANVAFHSRFASAVIFSLAVIAGIAVIFTRVKGWILAIPVISVVAIAGCIAFASSNELIREFVVAEDIFIIVSDFVGSMIISSAVILIAMFFWLASVSRNKIPLWLQIAFPIILPVIYAVAAATSVTVFNLSYRVPFGAVAVSLLTLIISLSVNCRRNASTRLP